MSTTDVVRTAVGASDVPRPIVLTINCPDKQRYLNRDNKMLVKLFGIQLVRINAVLGTEDRYHNFVPPPYAYPDREDCLLSLLKRYPDKGVTALKEFLSSQEMVAWVRGELEDSVRRFFSENGVSVLGWEDDVRVVIIGQNLLEEDSRLQTYLPVIFPQADFYRAVGFPEQPGLLWTDATEEYAEDGVPICTNCGNKMRAAGPGAYVCESCGTTHGVTPTDHLDS